AFLRGQPAQVWVRDAGGQERPVTDSPAGVGTFAWSPDGRRIATAGPPEVGAAADPDEPPKTIIEVRLPEPLPPGHVLRVTDLASAYAHPGAGTRLVATAAPGVTWSYPVWSPDGQRLALVENAIVATLQSAPHAEEELHLAVVELETGRVQYPAGRS